MPRLNPYSARDRGAKASPRHRRRPCLHTIAALFFAAASPLAFGDSGISHSQFMLVDGPQTPPPHQKATQKWRLDISNTNSVCDEAVWVTREPKFVNDYRNQDLAENLRSGSVELSGFSSTGGEACDGDEEHPDSVLCRHLEDESCTGSDCARPPLSVFFEVTTGENAQGCDFKGYEMPDITIADRGLYCFTCCDVCDDKTSPEPPTPYKLTLTIDAESVNTPGTGTIYGWVSRQVANQIVGQVAKVSAKKLGQCVVDAIDNTDPFDQHQDSLDGPVQAPSERGCYVFHDVPLGDYMVRATGDGAPFNQVDLSLTSNTPLEVNLCDGSSCPSNPECAP